MSDLKLGSLVAAYLLLVAALFTSTDRRSTMKKSLLICSILLAFSAMPAMAIQQPASSVADTLVPGTTAADEWLFDQYQLIKHLRVQLLNKPPVQASGASGVTVDAKTLKGQCVEAVNAYNKKAETMHKGVFKRRQLPEVVSVKDCG